jgi:hypothetical protein
MQINYKQKITLYLINFSHINVINKTQWYVTVEIHKQDATT